MRKITRWIGLFLALALFAAACGSDGESSTNDGAASDNSSDNTSSDTAAADASDEESDSETSGEPVTITIESWRSDDLAIWNDQIIPAFEAEFPNIHVEFNPSPPADYNAALATRLEGGIAGDLITCRPFDASLALFDEGHLAPLNDLEGIDNFSSVAQSAWITDDGASPFCVAYGIGHPRFHLQQDRVRRARPCDTRDRRRVLCGSRSNRRRRYLRSAWPRHCRSMGSGHSWLPEHRSELLGWRRRTQRAYLR